MSRREQSVKQTDGVTLVTVDRYCILDTWPQLLLLLSVSDSPSQGDVLFILFQHYLLPGTPGPQLLTIVC